LTPPPPPPPPPPKKKTKTLGAFHSYKNFKILETGTYVTEISWEGFQKIWKLLNS